MTRGVSQPTRYDVVIVGGGPSGSTLGALLARVGLSVLIIDRSEFPRDKLCGGLVSPRGADAIRNAFGEEVLRQVAVKRNAGCRLFHKERLVADIEDAGISYSVDRREMDARFLSIARDAGCRVSEGTRVVGVELGDSAVRLESGRHERGSIIVGADGAQSVVQRAIHGRADSNRRNMGFALVSRVPLELVKDDGTHAACRGRPHLFFGVVPWGYGWIFPKGDHLLLGMGGLTRKGSRFRGAFEALADAYCVAGARSRLKVRGGLVPAGNFGRSPGHGNVLLLGDAAGLAEPCTGEGIVYAVESALLAAAAIRESRARGEPASAGRLYSTACRRKLLPWLRCVRRARWLLYSKPCMPLAMRAFRRRPELLRMYYQMADGKMSFVRYFRHVVLGF